MAENIEARQDVAANASDSVRFAVVTDAHAASLEDERSEYLRAALADIAKDKPDFVVFAGDLANASHAPQWGQNPAILFAEMSIPLYLLRGNSDLAVPPFSCPPGVLAQDRFHFTLGRFAFIGFDTAEGRFSEPEDRWLQQQLRRYRGKKIILFTHYYLGAVDFDERSCERLKARMEEFGVQHLICGHGHRTQQHAVGSIRQDLVAAIDPFKPGSHQPGYEWFQVQADQLQRSRRRISLLTADALSDFMDRLSCAASQWENPRSLERVLRQNRLRHVQLDPDRQAAVPLDDQAIAEVRRWLDADLLRGVTLHLSTPVMDAAGNLTNADDFQGQLEVCLQLGAKAVICHLPLWDQRLLFDADETLRDEQLAHKLLNALAEPLAGFWRNGIRVELENTHWYNPQKMPEALGEHRLGIRIHHLRYFREGLETLLHARCGTIEGACVRFCFDVGHAMINGPLSETMTVQDWVRALAGHITAIHFYDTVVLPDVTRQAHFPMGTPGGLLGLEGFIYLKQKYAPEAVVHVEVKELAGVQATVEYLKEWRRVDPVQTA